MNATTLKQIVDEIFTVVETSFAANPLVSSILKVVQDVVDSLIPVILGNLKAKGIVKDE